VMSLFVLFFFFVSFADETCYAPPLEYGSPCLSSLPLVGLCCTTVVYSFNVTGDTQVFCQPYGTGYPTSGANCTAGFQLGALATGVLEVGWSAFEGIPQIKCFGSPSGVSLTWSWKPSAKCLSCPQYCPEQADRFSCPDVCGD